MALRQLIIEQPSRHGGHMHVQVQVDDRAAIGPWIATLAVRFGYPLVDPFGSPLTYRLRSVSGDQVLPTTGRFADARFPSGCHVVLELEKQRTMPIWAQGREGRRTNQISIAAMCFSRRSLISILAACSFLGFGSGMTTAFAQRLLTQSAGAIEPIAVHTLVGALGQHVALLHMHL